VLINITIGDVDRYTQLNSRVYDHVRIAQLVANKNINY
jgi:hypothetical protein